MLFRQLFDPRSSTYSYLLADEQTREAVLIDPVYEQHERDAALVRELDLRVLTCLDTHVHADHVTGAWLARERFGCRIALAAAAGATGVDRPLRTGDRVDFGRHALEVLETPGHTSGCLSYVLDDRSMVFTGDALLIRGAGRTDFQQGDAKRLFHSVREVLFALPDDCLVYPAHDYAGRTATSIGEERAHNPRLGGDANEGDFVGYMSNLGLAHPKQIDHALPANLECGRPPDGNAPAAPTWGPVHRTYAGVNEVEPEWLVEHRAEVHVLDVREPAEWNGELGHIAGAQHIPLGELRERLPEVPRERPVVTVCRSGRRSAQASLILEKEGFERVANLSCGMLRWHTLRHSPDP